MDCVQFSQHFRSHVRCRKGQQRCNTQENTQKSVVDVWKSRSMSETFTPCNFSGKQLALCADRKSHNFYSCSFSSLKVAKLEKGEKSRRVLDCYFPPFRRGKATVSAVFPVCFCERKEGGFTSDKGHTFECCTVAKTASSFLKVGSFGCALDLNECVRRTRVEASAFQSATNTRGMCPTFTVS